MSLHYCWVDTLTPVLVCSESATVLLRPLRTGESVVILAIGIPAMIVTSQYMQGVSDKVTNRLRR